MPVLQELRVERDRQWFTGVDARQGLDGLSFVTGSGIEHELTLVEGAAAPECFGRRPRPTRLTVSMKAADSMTATALDSDGSKRSVLGKLSVEKSVRGAATLAACRAFEPDQALAGTTVGQARW